MGPALGVKTSTLVCKHYTHMQQGISYHVKMGKENICQLSEVKRANNLNKNEAGMREQNLEQTKFSLSAGKWLHSFH